MNTRPNFIKNTLFDLISEMDHDRQSFVKNPEKDFIRNRVFSFSTIMKFILSSGSSSITSEILRFFSYEKFPTASAFVQQRQKIRPEAFQYLFRNFTHRMDSSPVLFNGYRLLAADGSDIVMPFNSDEPENIRGQEHCNHLHLNTFYDLCSRYYLDAEISPGSKNAEAESAVSLLERMEEKWPVILVADRGYENYNLFAHVEERLFDYVIRIKDRNSNGMLSPCDLPDQDEFDVTKILVLTRKSTGPAMVNRKKYRLLDSASRFDYVPDTKAEDYELTIRFVRFKIGDKYVALATSLNEFDFPADDLKQIYRLRWGIETSYRELKHVLGMVSFHSKKADCIKQEIYAHLIMYNFGMFIAAPLIPEEKTRKNPVQINYTQALKICRDFFRLAANAPPFEVEAVILKYVLPVREGRSSPRKTVSTVVNGFGYRLT